MANEHESLVEAVTAEIRNQDTLTDEELANVIVCLIAERTKVATPVQTLSWGALANKSIFIPNAAEGWSAMHAASALWPPALPTQAQQMEGDR